MIICSCNELSDADVRRAFACGYAASAGKVHHWNGCLIQCGHCMAAIQRVLDEEANGGPGASSALKPAPSDAGVPAGCPIKCGTCAQCMTAVQRALNDGANGCSGSSRATRPVPFSHSEFAKEMIHES